MSNHSQAYREIKRGEVCPICEKEGRCKTDASGDRRLCFRVVGDHVNGFRKVKTTGECSTYVRIDSPANRNGRAPKPVGPADLKKLAERYAKALTDERAEAEADRLGVSVESLRAVGAGLDDHGRLCFPERSTGGAVSAIVARHVDGTKRAGRGHRRGLTVPDEFEAMPGPVLVLEGATDSAAAVTMGLTAIGRPNASGGAELLLELLEGRAADVIVIGENDQKEDGRWPGRDGAKRIAAKLAAARHRPVAWALPPHDVKDVREYLRQGGDAGPAERGRQLLAHLQSNLNWATPDDADKSKPKQADVLVKLAGDCELWHGPGADDEAFATVRVGEHAEHHAVRSSSFKRWLVHRFFVESGGAPCAQAMTDALATIAAKAVFDGREHVTAVRVGGADGKVYLDLCDHEWRVVEVTRDGWRVIPAADCPVRFVRRRGMQALPVPTHGGSIDDLRPLVNVATDAAFILLVSFVVDALRPDGPYVVLALNGEQGSGKSTTCRRVRALIDSNEPALRRPPRDERDMMIAARNAWLIAYDNVSHIRPELSDGLCSVATGAGFGVRRLYFNFEEAIFCAARPIMLNGIGDVVVRPDLLDRAVVLTLPTIDEADRRDEAELDAAFEAARPRILGVLLDGVVSALANVGSVKLDRRPRMLDFAKWAAAAAPAFGWTAEAFLDAYCGNRAAAQDSVIDGSPVGMAIAQLMESRTEWRGTATELLDTIEADVDDKTRHRPGWPKTPHGLSGSLRRLAPALRVAGLDVTFTRSSDRTRRRQICIRTAGEGASVASEASTNAPDGLENATGAGRSGTHVDATAPAERPTDNGGDGQEKAGSDAVDTVDANLPACSEDDSRSSTESEEVEL